MYINGLALIDTVDENMISLMPAKNFNQKLYNWSNTVLRAKTLKSQKRAWRIICCMYFWGHFPGFECHTIYSSVLISPASTSHSWYALDILKFLDISLNNLLYVNFPVLPCLFPSNFMSLRRNRQIQSGLNCLCLNPGTWKAFP